MTAIVAALQVATESGSPAHFDGSHDAALCCRERRAVLFTVAVAVAAEHVRHFRPARRH